jgi:hypothetical protein
MFDVLVVDNEKGIGCLGNLECLMRRPADDVKLQERWIEAWKVGVTVD